MLSNELGRTHQGIVDLVTQSAGKLGQDDHVLSHGLGLDSDFSQDILYVLLEAVHSYLPGLHQ